jgi:hypothetical protein
VKPAESAKQVRYVDITDVDSSPLKIKAKRHIVESDEDTETADDHYSETEYADDDEGTSFVPIFSPNHRLNIDTRHYDHETALFDLDAERVIDENFVRAAAAPQVNRRGRDGSGSPDLDLSPSHAAKKRRLNTNARDGARPQDVLKAHQATKAPKDTQKQNQKTRSDKALKQVLGKPTNGRGIPDVRDIRRAADERALEERREREHKERRRHDKQHERDKGRRIIEVDEEPVWPDDYLDDLERRNTNNASDSNAESLQVTPKATRKRKSKKAKKTQAAAEQPSSEDDNDSARPSTQIGAYTPYSQMLLKRMKLNFRQRIYTVDPFPSDGLRTKFGEESWQAATQQLNSVFLRG